MTVSAGMAGATGGPILPMVAKWRESVDRAEKSELVATLATVFQDTGVIVVAHYSGLTVAQMTALRAKMREAGGSVKVAKNRLAKLALKGTDAESISDLFEGPTVIAFSKDPVAAAKVAIDFAKTNDKLVILGGAMGTDRPRRRRRQGARHAAVARRAARQARRHDRLAGHPDRAGPQRPGGAACTGSFGLRREERGGIRQVQRISNGSNR